MRKDGGGAPDSSAERLWETKGRTTCSEGGQAENSGAPEAKGDKPELLRTAVHDERLRSVFEQNLHFIGRSRFQDLSETELGVHHPFVLLKTLADRVGARDGGELRQPAGRFDLELPTPRARRRSRLGCSAAGAATSTPRRPGRRAGAAGCLRSRSGCATTSGLGRTIAVIAVARAAHDLNDLSPHHRDDGMTQIHLAARTPRIDFFAYFGAPICSGHTTLVFCSSMDALRWMSRRLRRSAASVQSDWRPPSHPYRTAHRIQSARARPPNTAHVRAE